MENLKAELQKKAEQFSYEFNFIQLDVVKTYIEYNDEYLHDVIRQPEEDKDFFGEYFDNYNLWEEYNQYLKDNEEEDTAETREKFADEESTDIDSFRSQKQDDNYPMWSTLFEFKYSPTEEIIQAAINSGFGVIESEHFNTILFVSGAGYSFMSQHWIPFYLGLPWTDKEKYKNIDFSDL